MPCGIFSQFFRHDKLIWLCYYPAEMGIEVKLEKPRSPWTSGQFERLIQSLKMIVAKLQEFPGYSVELALKTCVFDYNT